VKNIIIHGIKNGASEKRPGYKEVLLTVQIIVVRSTHLLGREQQAKPKMGKRILAPSFSTKELSTSTIYFPRRCCSHEYLCLRGLRRLCPPSSPNHRLGSWTPSAPPMAPLHRLRPCPLSDTHPTSLKVARTVRKMGQESG
jgi:hypothetical protein